MRETREVGKKYRKPGDARLIPEGRKYLGLLKQALLKKGRIPTGRLDRVLPDGSVIRVDTRHGIDRIFIETPDIPEGGPQDELFLESGYLALGASTGHIFWTQGLQQDALIQQTFLDYMHGYKLSFSTREYEEYMTSVPWASGYENISRTAALFSNSNWGALPGKSALFFQSAVGAKRHPSENIPALYIAGTLNRSQLFRHTKELSYNLYTSSKNKYYLIRSAGTDDSVTLSYAEIGFTEVGEALRAAMEGEFEDFQDAGARADTEFTKLEAYLFTQAKSVDGWVEIATFECKGYPITLSWNTMWNGNIASMVTHEEKVYTAGAPNGPGIEYMISRTYRYELTEDVEGYPATVTVDLEDTTNWTPAERQVFWSASVDPASGEPSMEAWEPRGCSGEFPDILDADAPVYAFYSDVNKRITLRCITEDLAGPPYALDRIAEFRLAKACRSTYGEGEFFNNGKRIALYFTEEDDGDGSSPVTRAAITQQITPDASGPTSAVVQAETGVNGYAEGFSFSVSETHTSFRCADINCAGKIQSVCSDRPYDPSFPCTTYSWPATSYCNRPDWVACSAYGINNNIAKFQCADFVGWRYNSSSPSKSGAQFAIIPFHSAEAVYVSQWTRVFAGNVTWNDFANNYLDSFQAYENSGDPSCEPTPSGSVEFACYESDGTAIGSTLAGCCATNATATLGPQTKIEQQMFLVTRSFTEELEHFVENYAGSHLWDGNQNYNVFYEPGFIMCFGEFTKHYDILIRAAGSAVQGKWVYDGPWGDGRDVRYSDESDDSLDNSGYNGTWSGRI